MWLSNGIIQNFNLGIVSFNNAGLISQLRKKKLILSVKILYVVDNNVMVLSTLCGIRNYNNIIIIYICSVRCLQSYSWWKRPIPVIIYSYMIYTHYTYLHIYFVFNWNFGSYCVNYFFKEFEWDSVFHCNRLNRALYFFSKKYVLFITDVPWLDNRNYWQLTVLILISLVFATPFQF